jgi:hypothetical protein
MLSPGYALEKPRNDGGHSWKNCNIDYQYLYFRLKILKERADNLRTSMTGLTSIVGNRLNLQETTRQTPQSTRAAVHCSGVHK